MTRKVFRCCLMIMLLFPAVQADESPPAQAGGIGFRLIDARDHSRYFLPEVPGDPATRSLRIYIWYPAADRKGRRLAIRDYLEMAADDFQTGSLKDLPSLPEQLKKGVRPDRVEGLLREETRAVRGATPASGPFPVVVVGQGLYYESPFSQYYLCESLAEEGFVAVSCPLAGTLSRLVNRTVQDLETQVRDMEFVLGYALSQPYVDAGRIGAAGYDLGGMAGLLMCMRHPEIKAYFSLDSGIVFDFGLGIPGTHPDYCEDRFVIPWMHLTQDRFIRYFQDQKKQEPLTRRKPYGASYLGSVPTDNHGCFTAYALMGIENPVPGYWGPVSGDMAALYREICRLAALFFDGYLNNNRPSLHELNRPSEGSGNAIRIEYNAGRTPPPSRSSFIHAIITRGLTAVLPEIELELKQYPAKALFDENELNWLGYHFLYWWGREAEAVEVFKLQVRLFPESANAFDSLGEAYLRTGKTELAIENYRISLKLNPENPNAKQILKQLEKER